MNNTITIELDVEDAIKVVDALFYCCGLAKTPGPRERFDHPTRARFNYVANCIANIIPAEAFPEVGVEK
jgi:hypothetical protein